MIYGLSTTECANFGTFFYVFLAVHLSIILAIDQLEAQIRFIISLLHSSTRICALSWSVAEINLGTCFVPIVEIGGCGAHLAKPDGVFFYLPHSVPDKLKRSG